MLRSLLHRNAFVLALVALSLLCVALSEARADVKGIPYNAQFDSAAFPHARVVGGCTAWRRPEKMGDQWGSVSFAGACQAHDLCFHSVVGDGAGAEAAGPGWGACNQRFLADLRASCDRDLKREQLGKGRQGDPDGQALQLCYEIANLYFAKVQDLASTKRYELAQRQERAYLAYVRKVVVAIYKASISRPPTAREADRALAALSHDYTLDDLRTGLMGAKLDRAASGEGSQLGESTAAGSLLPARAEDGDDEKR